MSDRDGDQGIFWQRADGTARAERLTTAEKDTLHIPASWSPDGTTLLFTVMTLAQAPTRSLWMLHDGKAAPFGDLRTSPTFALSPVFSPDGRWVAYAATSGVEKGDIAAYVRPFPRPLQSIVSPVGFNRSGRATGRNSSSCRAPGRSQCACRPARA